MVDSGSRARTPRWVWVSGIVVVVLTLVVAIVGYTGAGGHGPGNHAPPERDHAPAGSPHR